jgi:hypothetical protein
MWNHKKGAIILGKTAHLYTFFKIKVGGTAQLLDPNSEHEFFTDSIPKHH